MNGPQHPQCGDDLEFDGEVALARLLIDSGDFVHGALHVSAALALDPTHGEVTRLLAVIHAELAAQSPDVIELADGSPSWVGHFVLRAALLRLNGRDVEAADILLQAIEADHERPWARLLRSWVDDDPSFPVPQVALLRCCSSVMSSVVRRAPTERELDMLVDLTVVLDCALPRYPDDAWLCSSASAFARRCGRPNDAVRWAEEADRLAPSSENASMIGYAHSAAGDERAAVEAFALAADRDRSLVSPRLDAALSLARLHEWETAAQWASSAWQLAPDNPRAATRTCLARWRATGDPDHVLQLIEWVRTRVDTPDYQPTPSLEDAVAETLDAANDLPWVASIPIICNASVNLARKYLADRASRDSTSEAGTLHVTLSEPDAPSALLALRQTFNDRVEMTVTVTDIPSPDPRVPRRAVKVLAWRLDGDELVPGVPEPSPRALGSMRVGGGRFYTIGDARHDAHTLTSHSDVTSSDLVALAVHPQPGPRSVTSWEWIRRWQVVCCLALGGLGDFEVLTDLADGPEDWLADSALAGLVELGNLDTKWRTSVVDFARGHLTESARRRTTLDLPHFANECDLIATIPWCPAELVRAACALRAHDRDDLTDH